MRNNLVVKSVIVMLSVMIFVLLFSGCKDKKDVYNAASEYIKVSHPEDTGDVDSSADFTSREDSSQDKETASQNLEGGETSSQVEQDSSNTDSSKDNTSGNTSSEDDERIEGDQGSVVIF